MSAKEKMEDAAVDLAMYRKALDQQFGVMRSDAYTLTHISQLNECAGAGIAFSLDEHVVWVLTDKSDGPHEVAWTPLFLAETAVELTEFFETSVIPAETSAAAMTVWQGKEHSPFAAYKFILADRPAKLRGWP